MKFAHLCTALVCSVKLLNAFEYNFFILKFHCITFLPNSDTSQCNIVSSEGLFRYSTSISRYA